MKQTNYTIDIEDISNIAIAAGKAIMNIYETFDNKIEYKKDNSPLTQADKIANEIICMELKRLTPNIPILTEESEQAPFAVRKNWERYWCIDPLDGTKEFINKNGEFTVNIAYLENNVPILGVVFAPCLNELYFAQKDKGAFWCDVLTNETIKLPISKQDKNTTTIVASRSHLNEQTSQIIDRFSQNHRNIQLTSIGSSLKFCLIAKGEADFYPRIAPTMEWDTAASDAILRECGKQIYVYHDSFCFANLKKEKTITYNKQSLLNPSFLVL